jgi:uncharacterized protein YyaL (SSP411 family)
LAVSALARGGGLLGEPRYLEAARRAAGRSWDLRFAEDYAFLAHGLLDLHEATLEARWLEQARALTETQLEEFRDPASGGFFLSRAAAIPQGTRLRNFEDGTLPSAASVAVSNLLRLKLLCGEKRYKDAADAAAASLARDWEEDPSHHLSALTAAEAALSVPLRVVVSGPAADPRTTALLAAARAPFAPVRALVLEPRSGPPSAQACAGTLCALPAALTRSLASLLAAKPRSKEKNK